MSPLERASYYCSFAVVFVSGCIWKFVDPLAGVVAGLGLLLAVLRLRLQHRLADLIRAKKDDQTDSVAEEPSRTCDPERDSGK